MNRATSALLAVGAALCLTVALPSAARADDLLPIEKANPGLSRTVVDSLPSVVKASSVKIDESFVAGSPIVYPDGTPVPGQSAKTKKAAAACGSTAFGPGSGAWGATSNGTCGVFGSPGYTRGYYWAIPAHVYTRGCLRARGFNSSGTATWYNVGCGTSGGSHVPWGNVLATPAAQAKSMAPPAGTTINWDE